VALDILVGTDVQLLAMGPDGSLMLLPNYTPNLQVRAPSCARRAHVVRAFASCCSRQHPWLTNSPTPHCVRDPSHRIAPQVEARDAFFGGDIRVRTKDNELSYTKNLDINGAMRQRQSALLSVGRAIR
jgi:hypothetical protein